MKKIWILPLAVWAALTLVSWFSPAKELSVSERRPLAQLDSASWEDVTSGRFMKDFEKYTLDQFPLRDGFRSVKAVFHSFCLGQKDNNDLYTADGYIVMQEYPLDQSALEHALNRFNAVYAQYLQPHDSAVYLAVVPDKGYFLAERSGHLAMDYDSFFETMRQGMPWAQYVDLTPSLSIEDYYRTDTHWRQEALPDTAALLCQAMGIPAPGDYTVTTVEKDFYGVYHGQLALPLPAEPLCVLENEMLAACSVYDHESGKTWPVYNTALESRDPYDVYLSGPRSLLTVRNPQGEPGRELIIFRDSFGSSIAPLLLQGYSQVTLVDIRYIQVGMLDRFVDFHGQDVLFLYSTLVLNNSQTIK